MIDTSFDIEPPTITSVIKEWVQFPLDGLKFAKIYFKS